MGRWSVVKIISINRDFSGGQARNFDLVILQPSKALLVFLWQMRIDLLVYDRLPNTDLNIGAKSCNYSLSLFLKVVW